MRLIINNHSDLPIKIVLLMVERVTEKNIMPTFNDYKYEGRPYTVVVAQNNKSQRFSIYNT